MLFNSKTAKNHLPFCTFKTFSKLFFVLLYSYYRTNMNKLSTYAFIFFWSSTENSDRFSSCFVTRSKVCQIFLFSFFHFCNATMYINSFKINFWIGFLHQFSAFFPQKFDCLKVLFVIFTNLSPIVSCLLYSNSDGMIFEMFYNI